MTRAPARSLSSARMARRSSVGYRTYAPSRAVAPPGTQNSRNRPMTWSTRIPPGVAEPGPHRLDERPVPGGAEPVRHERREPPVLPLEREVVGRRPHRDTLGQHVLPCPGVGALAVEADGEVGHQAKGPPGASQLLVEQPLEPGVKRDPLPLLGGEARDRGRRGMPVLGRPAPPPRPVTLGERAEDRELLEASALPGAVARERGAPAAPSRPELVEGRHLQPEHGVPIDPALGVEGTPLGGQPLHVEPGLRRAGHLLDPEVERIPVAAARGEIRARLLRHERERRVERVQDDRARPERRSRTSRRAAGDRRGRRSPSSPGTGARRAGSPSPRSGALRGGGSAGAPR